MYCFEWWYIFIIYGLLITRWGQKLYILLYTRIFTMKLEKNYKWKKKILKNKSQCDLIVSPLKVWACLILKKMQFSHHRTEFYNDFVFQIFKLHVIFAWSCENWKDIRTFVSKWPFMKQKETKTNPTKKTVFCAKKGKTTTVKQSTLCCIVVCHAI